MKACRVLTRLLVILRELNDSAEHDPRIALSLNLKGLALSNQGKYNEAIEAFDKAIEMAPEWKVPRNNKSIALQELGWHEKGEIEVWHNQIQEIPGE
ncbi:Tetratricopeptide repeat protein [uncultured archaeon]|nr:Tetratricopeptide repeat protein [uncultured archaeon]